MSNTKAVEIQGRVPYDWLDSWHDGPGTKPAITDEDRAFLCRLFMSPVMGLKLRYRDDGYEPTMNGGQLNMQVVTITGREALRYEALTRIVEIIAKAGEVTTAVCCDLDDRGEWGAIPTAAQNEASRVSAEAHVAKLMKGKHWVTVGNTSHLEAD